jgi:hypothetical protein
MTLRTKPATVNSEIVPTSTLERRRAQAESYRRFRRVLAAAASLSTFGGSFVHAGHST